MKNFNPIIIFIIPTMTDILELSILKKKVVYLSISNKYIIL